MGAQRSNEAEETEGIRDLLHRERKHQRPEEPVLQRVLVDEHAARGAVLVGREVGELHLNVQ